MKVQSVKIDSVIEYANNPRNNDASVDKVAASIKEYGWQQPIVVDSEMVIVAGHTRLLAAKKLGIKKVPVHIADQLTPQQVKAYRLADNRIGEDSAWDFESLALELSELKDTDLLTGFSDTELHNLLSNDIPRLDDLDDKTDESDFWPSIYIKVSPDTKQQWDYLMEEVSNHVESENEAVELILASVDRKSIAAV
ncbi:MAG: ParB N-terminal domain-containing protein [Proteobacteria bacterium]|nr:ParB N-terminal domain-containing protein [Pseudomonadota bacterium]